MFKKFLHYIKYKYTYQVKYIYKQKKTNILYPGQPEANNIFKNKKEFFVGSFFILKIKKVFSGKYLFYF